MSAGDAGDPADGQDLKVGDKVGPYRLVKLLGHGATGRVFEVEHERIARRAAMKLLSAEHAGRPGAIRRLFNEAQAVNRINNPHIVEVTDVVEADAGANAIVMELLEGQSLGQAMMHDGVMLPDRFLPILAQVCDALAAAHTAGFVHRDLKPDNIFLTERGGQIDFVKLLDFGLAKMVAPDPETARDIIHPTADGVFLGTPAYVSPEQASGKPVDHRTDIYSLGVILYELVCGRLPFEGKNMGEYLVKHITLAPPDAPAEVMKTRLGRTLDGIARRCLEKDPLQRFSSVGQLSDVFMALARGQAVEVTKLGVFPRSSPRRSLTIGAAVALGMALAAGAGVWLASRGSTPERRTAAATGVPAPATARPPAIAVTPVRNLVVLTFDSKPPGAETRRRGEAKLLGLTPFHQSFDRSQQELEFEMSLPGFRPARVRANLRENGFVRAVLERAEAGGKKKPTGEKSGSVSREGTVDPFR